MQVVFVDPPVAHPNPKPRGGAPLNHPWDSIAEQLKARPGEWALCLRDIHVHATNIRHGKIKAFQPAGAFQTRTVQTHKVDDKGRPTVDLYIKYTPLEEEK